MEEIKGGGIKKGGLSKHLGSTVFLDPHLEGEAWLMHQTRRMSVKGGGVAGESESKQTQLLCWVRSKVYLIQHPLAPGKQTYKV